MRVKLFEEHNFKKNALSLFLITLLFCFIGSHLRIPEELSLFWPVNALIAGLMVRNPFLHQARYYLACFSAMVLTTPFFLAGHFLLLRSTLPIFCLFWLRFRC